jgi:hypothetical protein
LNAGEEERLVSSVGRVDGLEIERNAHPNEVVNLLVPLQLNGAEFVPVLVNVLWKEKRGASEAVLRR